MENLDLRSRACLCTIYVLYYHGCHSSSSLYVSLVVVPSGEIASRSRNCYHTHHGVATCMEELVLWPLFSFVKAHFFLTSMAAHHCIILNIFLSISMCLTSLLTGLSYNVRCKRLGMCVWGLAHATLIFGT